MTKSMIYKQSAVVVLHDGPTKRKTVPLFAVSVVLCSFSNLTVWLTVLLNKLILASFIFFPYSHMTTFPSGFHRSVGLALCHRTAASFISSLLVP